ncbi:L-threonine aldolase [Lachnospiraceae bacterium XBB1006]|nr:L-threonine aldolase [Lachnospiraceae bacterium XBB1006]
MQEKLNFASDYLEGAHPDILKRLVETNLEQSAGYGMDVYSERARELIRKACDAPEAEVYFLVGGTQTNATVIDAFLRSYQGVIAAETGHINVHEAGAIETNGHKVLALPHTDGKLQAEVLQQYLEHFFADESYEHMVIPGMVYLSQPTEYGTLYQKEELVEIKKICERYKLPLYVDGARLAYALACKENDVTLADLAVLCDAFYIGGTKCGALFGEAVVITNSERIPHFFTIVKQHGALLAKGRIAGIQFETLFTQERYWKMGENGIKTANAIRKALEKKGYQEVFPSATNQVFICMEKAKADRLRERAQLSVWEIPDADHVVLRICTSWATKMEDVEKLIALL